MTSRAVYMRSPEGAVFTTHHPEYHKECERLTQAEGRCQRRDYCRDELRKLIQPGTTVYTQLRSVAGSGMSRVLSVLIVDCGRIRNIDTLTLGAIDYSEGPKGGIKVNGCGMDAGFAVVYALGTALWPEGTLKPHGTRNGAPDSVGGYALRHEWL